MLKPQWSIAFAIIILVAIPTTFAEASETGSVSGTIQIQGTRVKTEGAKSDKDIVVYLEKVGGSAYPPPSEHALLDQANLVFVPHVLAIQKGASVDFLNSDTTDHNVFCVDECCKLVEDINSKKPKYLDLGNFPGGQRASHTFTVPGEAVILCKLHPEMAAYIIVLDTPHFTVAEVDGATQSATYTIADVPPGDYVLKTWSKKCQSLEQKVSVSAEQEAKADIELQRKTRKRRRR